MEREIDMSNDFSDLESDDEDEDEEDEAAAEEAGIITKEEGGEEEEEEEEDDDDDELEEDDDVMSVEHFYVFKARRGAASGHENESRGTARSLRDASLRAAGVLP